jgi:Holliday junction resolvasome RuvABC endonuclease subunit
MPPFYGVWQLGSMANIGRCFSCLANQMQLIIADRGIEAVVLEAPLPRQARDTQELARLLIGLAAVAQMVTFECGLPPAREEFPKNVRKLVLGRGDAKKEHVMQWCRGMGWNPADDNAGDALALLRWRHMQDRMRIMAGAGSV